jgi:hypothetical protein
MKDGITQWEWDENEGRYKYSSKKTFCSGHPHSDSDRARLADCAKYEISVGCYLWRFYPFRPCREKLAVYSHPFFR